MRSDRYDLIVIGSGPAGESAAEFAAWFGRRAVVIERDQPGGTVTTTGGAPTKTLREAALAFGRSRSGAHADGASDGAFEAARPRLRERTLAVRESLQSAVARQFETRGVDYVRGDAWLLPGRRVEVREPSGARRTLQGDAILVATGSRPTRFPGVPFDDRDVYDSDEVYALTRVPSDVVIAGGGPVGVEFATVLTALDVPVTLVDGADRLLPAMDREIADLMAAELEKDGVRLVLGAHVRSVVRDGTRLDVALSTGGTLSADAVLFAAGRTANTEGLGLAEVGVALDARGRIVVDREFRTSVAGVYAAGDVIGPTLASIAAQQGRAAACHAFGLVFGVAVDRAPGAAVYGMPEIAGVGATEEQVRTAGTPYVVGRCDLATIARGAIAGRGGMLKLIVSREDRRLLGVHAIGEIASELMGMGHVVLHAGGTIDPFLLLAFNTPTYSQAYRHAAIDALIQLARRTAVTSPTLEGVVR